MAAESFDHVLANPPFHVEGRGTAAGDPVKAAANAMPEGALDRWVRFMAAMARPGGSVTLIHRAEALQEVLAALDGRFGGAVVLPIHPARASLPRACWCRPSRAAAPLCSCGQASFCTTPITASGPKSRPFCGMAQLWRSGKDQPALEFGAPASPIPLGTNRPATADANSQLQTRTTSMRFSVAAPVVPVLRFSGPIGMATPLRPGLALSTVAGPIEKAFSLSKLPTVAIVINSPGGSPVQSNLIFSRIRQLAKEKQKRVYVFCEDMAASGGYFLALAGDEIYADPSSIVGSIGVISASFGLDKFIERFGIERRVHTSGKDKGALDPFQPERPDDVARLLELQRDVHDVFTGMVKERRAGKLKGPEEELFSGAFWSAAKAREYGLIDGMADLRAKMQALHGTRCG